MSKSKTKVMLILKYGTLSNAYKHWMNTPPDKEHGLTSAELSEIHSWCEAMREECPTPSYGEYDNVER